MPGGNVQHFALLSFVGAAEFRKQLGRHSHQWGHGTRKFNPDRILWCDSSFILEQRSALAHYRSDVLEVIGQLCRADEPHRGTCIRGRFAIQKGCRFERQSVAVSILGEEADDHKIVAQDAHASLGSAATPREGFCRVGSLRDGGEQIKFDCALQARCALVGVHRLKE